MLPSPVLAVRKSRSSEAFTPLKYCRFACGYLYCNNQVFCNIYFLYSGHYDFSQLCAKASVPDICSIPIQANKARQIIGVSFDLNDAPEKTGRELNARRNARFSAAIAKRINNVVSDYL